MKTPAHILVIEDNATTARTIRLFLEFEGFKVECVASGRTAVEKIRAQDYDLVVLDLMLPDLDGMAVCRTLRETSHTPVVMLTAKSTEDEIVAGLEAGADDYVCKPFGSKELLARIRRCLRANPAAVSEAKVEFEFGELRIDLERRLAWLGPSQIGLTRSEFEILALLMRHPGRVFTRHQIIEGALGRDFEGFDRTVDTHVWSLRRKLGEPRGAPRYIQSELGVGYRLAEKPGTAP